MLRVVHEIYWIIKSKCPNNNYSINQISHLSWNIFIFTWGGCFNDFSHHFFSFYRIFHVQLNSFFFFYFRCCTQRVSLRIIKFLIRCHSHVVLYNVQCSVLSAQCTLHSCHICIQRNTRNHFANEYTRQTRMNWTWARHRRQTIKHPHGTNIKYTSKVETN